MIPDGIGPKLFIISLSQVRNLFNYRGLVVVGPILRELTFPPLFPRHFIACTVGFGDYSPTTQTGKMIAIVFIPLAVASMGHWLGLIASWIIEGRSARHRKKMYGRELTQRDLDIMDVDGDGQVTRAEFLEFMLIAMNRIDKDLMNELRDHFDRLDVDGTGTLSREDLVENARRKVHTVRHKLHLSAYRERLLEQGRNGGHVVDESFWGNLLGRSGFAKGVSTLNLS